MYHHRYWRDYRDRGVKREPAYTLTEFAQKVNIKYSTLYSRFMSTKNRPSPTVKNGRKKYFPLNELEAWFKQAFPTGGNKNDRG